MRGNEGRHVVLLHPHISLRGKARTHVRVHGRHCLGAMPEAEGASRAGAKIMPLAAQDELKGQEGGGGNENVRKMQASATFKLLPEDVQKKAAAWWEQNPQGIYTPALFGTQGGLGEVGRAISKLDTDGDGYISRASLAPTRPRAPSHPPRPAAPHTNPRALPGPARRRVPRGHCRGAAGQGERQDAALRRHLPRGRDHGARRCAGRDDVRAHRRRQGHRG